MAKKLTLKQVEQMIDEAIHEKTRPLVNQYIKEMTKEIRSAIVDFYEDYNPISYDRTRSFVDFFRVHTKKTMYGYVVTYEFDSDELFPDHYSWDRKDTHSPQEINEMVFNMDFVGQPWIRGIEAFHGGKIGKRQLPRATTYPSPWERIQKSSKKILSKLV